jgi:hypothetical protein
MKGDTHSSRLSLLAANLVGSFTLTGKESKRSKPKNKPSVDERRGLDRKDFPYYMQLIDQDTQQLVGHLADISSGGFKLDSLSPIPPKKDFRFRLDLTSEVADKPFMIFVARSRWCTVDPLDPFCYNVGFQLVNISPGDIEIFNRMIEKYGKKHKKQFVDLRRTNIW